MGRTPGAKNKSSRELRSEGTHKIQVSKLKDKLAKKDQQIAALKKKPASK